MKKDKNLKVFKRTYSDKIFDVVNLSIMLILLFIFAFPLWFVLIASISDPNLVLFGEVLLLPKGITLDAYETMKEHGEIWVGYGNTIIYTVVGTILNMFMTVCAAYPLSRKDFMLGKFFMVMFMITMYFNGGLIPTYIVVNKLGLLDNRWAMIIPGAVSIYNVIITRTYFRNSIPESLYEAATIDGVNSAQYLTRIVIPLSKPVLSVVMLYYAVAHWNDYYTALLYIYDKKLRPLQTILRDLLLTTQLQLNDIAGMDAADVEQKMRLAQTMKYSVIIIAMIPVLCIYPFIQKHFVKGMMIGSIKG